jgi:hypothetical protein
MFLEPEIYRRILVYDNTGLDILHFIIQDAMGLDNYNLHHFIKDKVIFSDPDCDDFDIGGIEEDCQ